MPTTFEDLPPDTWESIAHLLPQAGRYGTAERFSLAATCKDVWAALVAAPAGGGWKSIEVISGDGKEAHVAAHAAGVLQLGLYLHQAGWEGGKRRRRLLTDLDDTLRRLQQGRDVVAEAGSPGGLVRVVERLGRQNRVRKVSMDANTVGLAGVAALTLLPAIAHHLRAVQILDLDMTSNIEFTPRVLAHLATHTPAVGAFIRRLESLALPVMPTAAFLGGATLQRLTLRGPFPPDLPALPHVVKLSVSMYSTPPFLFTGDAHARHCGQCFPRLDTLWLNGVVAHARPAHFATFVRGLAPSLKRMEVDAGVVAGTLSDWPPGLDALALEVMGVVALSQNAGVIGVDVGALAPHPLTRLYFRSEPNTCRAQEVRIVAPVAAWAFPALRHLDVRGFRSVAVDGGALKAVRGLPLPVVPPGSLPLLETLLLGYTAKGKGGLFDVAQIARWAAAPRLAILVVERARLAASRGAAEVKADVAVHKPCLKSVHLHECTVAREHKAALEALVGGCSRGVCRRRRVEECLFGQDWWDEYKAMF